MIDGLTALRLLGVELPTGTHFHTQHVPAAARHDPPVHHALLNHFRDDFASRGTGVPVNEVVLIDLPAGLLERVEAACHNADLFERDPVRMDVVVALYFPPVEPT